MPLKSTEQGVIDQVLISTNDAGVISSPLTLVAGAIKPSTSSLAYRSEEPIFIRSVSLGRFRHYEPEFHRSRFVPLALLPILLRRGEDQGHGIIATIAFCPAGSSENLRYSIDRDAASGFCG
jgi:hypothetical protein